jgi:hypothetical protein
MAVAYGSGRLAELAGEQARHAAEARRPRWLAGGDLKARPLHQMPVWECPVCLRRWHWVTGPRECGFCPQA